MKLFPAMLCLCGALCACATPKPASAPTTAPVSNDHVYARPSIDQAIADGIKYLEADQNPDGSWGAGTESHGNEISVSVPSSHEAFRVAVTSLCVMALRQCGETKAHDKGVEFLLEHGDTKRADPGLIYNIWSNCYVVEALAIESRFNHDPRLAGMIDLQLYRMQRYESYLGGWNYYDFNGGAEQPAGGPTSFGTAAGLVAIRAAQDAGFQVSDILIKPSLRRLEEMRLPNGNFLYGTDYKYLPVLDANLVRGSIGRTQPSNYCLLLWNSKKVTNDDAREGLETFFREHASLDAGRKREWPHEAPYQTSGYYYYFDHYYASLLMNRLGAGAHGEFAPQMLSCVMPYQEPDGSWWDYCMWDYHKPYGTAFAIMTLMNCK